jgi:hypothetical protein
MISKLFINLVALIGIGIRLPNQTKLVGVPDQTTNAHMFILQPKWLQNIYDYLLEGMMLERFTIS